MFESGERLALLTDVSSGLPLFDPTVFVVSEYRARNRSNATIDQVLRALKVLLLFCRARNIDLQERMLEGELLDLGEVDDLVAVCRYPMAEVEALISVNSSAKRPQKTGSVISLERFRMRQSKGPAQIAGDSAALRIRYIRQYIEWLANRSILGRRERNRCRETLICARDAVTEALDARVPSGKSLNGGQERLALDESDQTRLWQIIEFSSSENPWKGSHARMRNELMIRWMMGLGVRRGELLGLKISDLNFRTNEAFIARRADDPEDPRANQPNAKTADRHLPMSADLAARTRRYILEHRRQYTMARKHEFLFVANGGAPLSMRGLNKIFEVLGAVHPGLPRVFPHLLRHTNNHNFSAIADDLKLDPEIEKKTRSQLMGWSETSGTAATYTRREVRRKAREASLRLQDGMVKPKV